MKKIFNNTFLHRTLGISLCFTALFCLCVTNVYAQDEIEEEEEVVVKKTAKPKKEKTYEMKEVTGFVVDDATGEPMGGVRVQALGLEKYSTLTDEDGSYKLSIPVFSKTIRHRAGASMAALSASWRTIIQRSRTIATSSTSRLVTSSRTLHALS